VTNVGEMFHRFEIEREGIEKEVEPGVDAGHVPQAASQLDPPEDEGALRFGSGRHEGRLLQPITEAQCSPPRLPR
jgi:hypothetical protein